MIVFSLVLVIACCVTLSRKGLLTQGKELAYLCSCHYNIHKENIVKE